MPTGGPDRPEVTGGKRRLAVPLVLFLLFLGPLVLASVLYFGSSDLRPRETANHGELIRPPIPLPALGLPEETLLRDVWTLVYIGAAPCDDSCREALHETRQVRLALGRKRDRVRRLYLQAGASGIPPDLRARHPDLSIVPIDAEHSALLDAFPGADGAAIESHKIYVVDPLGNLMMYYPPGADPSGLLEDLERLLRLSHIG